MTSETRVTWEVEDRPRYHEAGDYAYHIQADGEYIGNVYSEANARRVIRAVNSHDDLVAALDDLLRVHRAMVHGENVPLGRQVACLDTASAAIRRARGED